MDEEINEQLYNKLLMTKTLTRLMPAIIGNTRFC